MAGKNKVARSIRLWIDDSGGTPRDVSGDLVPGTLAAGGLLFEEAEMTGESETVRNFLTNHATAPISCQLRVNDTADTGSYTVMQGNIGGTGTLTAEWGESGAAPTTGDIDWSGEYAYMGMPISISDGGAVMDCTFLPTGGTAPAFGTVT